MALISYGFSRCAICHELLEEGDAMFATSGVVFVPPDPLFQFCDAPMHWSCYASWPQRPRFARGYFDDHVERERTNPYWARAYLDDDVLITVNPDRLIYEVDVTLAANGSGPRVKLREWDAWLADDDAATAGMHPAEAAALLEVLPILRFKVPTAEAILEACDWESKRAIWANREANHQLELQREKERRRAMAPRNDATKQLAKRATKEGLACPHCRAVSRDYRLIENRLSGRVELICRACGWTFDVDLRGTFSA